MSLKKKKQFDDLWYAKIKSRNADGKEEGIETTGSVNHKTTCDDKTNGDGKCNQPLDVFSGR